MKNAIIGANTTVSLAYERTFTQLECREGKFLFIYGYLFLSDTSLRNIYLACTFCFTLAQEYCIIIALQVQVLEEAAN